MIVREGTFEKCVHCGSHYVERRPDPWVTMCPMCITEAEMYYDWLLEYEVGN